MGRVSERRRLPIVLIVQWEMQLLGQQVTTSRPKCFRIVEFVKKKCFNSTLLCSSVRPTILICCRIKIMSSTFDFKIEFLIISWTSGRVSTGFSFCGVKDYQFIQQQIHTKTLQIEWCVVHWLNASTRQWARLSTAFGKIKMIPALPTSNANAHQHLAAVVVRIAVKHHCWFGVCAGEQAASHDLLQ